MEPKTYKVLELATGPVMLVPVADLAELRVQLADAKSHLRHMTVERDRLASELAKANDTAKATIDNLQAQVDLLTERHKPLTESYLAAERDVGHLIRQCVAAYTREDERRARLEKAARKVRCGILSQGKASAFLKKEARI